MKMTFTKRTGKYDDLLIERDGAPPQIVACPKQGIVPHDMVHFAVEATLAHRGFLGLVADGARAEFTTTAGDSEEAIERLVEVFQAEMWGGRVPTAAFLTTYEQACAARGHPASPVSAEDVEAIRTRLDVLSAQWNTLPVNAALSFDFDR